MAKDLPAPITHRPLSHEDRALLELVAKHQDITVSKLVAQIARDYARAYVAEIGLDKIIAENQAAEAAQNDLMMRQLGSMLQQAGVSQAGGAKPAGTTVKVMKSP